MVGSNVVPMIPMFPSMPAVAARPSREMAVELREADAAIDTLREELDFLIHGYASDRFGHNRAHSVVVPKTFWSKLHARLPTRLRRPLPIKYSDEQRGVVVWAAGIIKEQLAQLEKRRHYLESFLPPEERDERSTARRNRQKVVSALRQPRLDNLLSLSVHEVAQPKFRNGECFFTWKKPLREVKPWVLSAKGVVLATKDGLCLQGEEPLFTGEFRSWSVLKDGGTFFIERFVDSNVEILLNGKEVLYRGRCDAWKPIEDGSIVVKRGNSLFYNGIEELYRGDTDKFKFETLDNGHFVVQRGNELLLDGIESVFEGLSFVDNWLICGSGIICQLVFFFILNGDQVVHQEFANCWWTAHDDGVIINKRGRWSFFNGKSD